MTRTLIATALVSVAIATGAVAVNVLQTPAPSIYVLLVAGVLALVLLRRRTS